MKEFSRSSSSYHVHFKSDSISGMELDRHCNNRPLTGRDIRPT